MIIAFVLLRTRAGPVKGTYGKSCLGTHWLYLASLFGNGLCFYSVSVNMFPVCTHSLCLDLPQPCYLVCRIN